MEKKIAVLIDAHNISAKFNKQINRAIAIHGEIVIKQVWGDFESPYMKSWRAVLAKEPEVIRQQHQSGKNATDTRIIIEAIKLMLLNPNINTLCIVSSDADFHVLAQEWRENGKYVLGIGEKKANQIWKESCNEFITLESLKREESGKTANIRLVA
jgi:uncharacterized protein (TIGR00288 family)